MIDRDEDGVSGSDEYGDIPEELNEQLDKEPDYAPECPVVPGSDDDNGIECEFENRDGHWWCSSHDCWA